MNLRYYNGELEDEYEEEYKPNYYGWVGRAAGWILGILLIFALVAGALCYME